MNIIWMAQSWEQRYICELLDIPFASLNECGKRYREINLIHPETLEDLNIYHIIDQNNDIEKMIKLNLSDQKNILIIGTGIKLKGIPEEKFNETILEYAKNIKPTITFLLSDEWGHSPELNQLCKFSKLVFRQYRHESYEEFENLLYLPLGYMCDYTEKQQNYLNRPFVKTSDRSFAWSFVGHIGLKESRALMVEKMSKIQPYYVRACDNKKFIKKKVTNHFNGKRLAAYEMKDIMDNSIFAPNEIGNVKIDCFRLYESSMCGAIPVICCSKEEFNFSFGKYNFGREPKRIPWLRFDDWEEASNECKEILKHPSEIERLSKENFKWWRDTIFNYKDRIKKVLNEK